VRSAAQRGLPAGRWPSWKGAMPARDKAGMRRKPRGNERRDRGSGAGVGARRARGAGDRQRRTRGTQSRDQAPRHALGGEQVEGRQAVRELLAANTRQVRELWIAEGLEPSAQIDEIERLATKRRVRIMVVGRRRLESMARTESPQGVLARAVSLEEADLDDLCTHPRAREPFLLVLDGVSDPQNLGSLLRTAECAGVTGVVLPRHRAAHVTPTVTKVAAGAVEHLPMAVVPGVPSALRRLEERGVLSVGLDAHAERSLFDLDEEASGPIGIVLGAEGKGLGALSRRRCDVVAAIPQLGSLNSLPVAAAGAVACFEVARRRSAERP
jgi:23S rRNA (guanosine2251-2'-O)-methyltransferase